MAAALSALKTENEAFRDRAEAQISERFEDRRKRLLVASMRTLETLDRAVDAARGSEAPEALLSGVMLVRTQLFRILQEEGLERVSVLGFPFDPRTSEIVERRPVTDPDQDGIVIEELQGGHELRGTILRRAKVAVGEYLEDAVAPTVAMPAVREPSPPPPSPAPPAVPPSAAEPPAELTVAMNVKEIASMAATPAPEPPRPAAPAAAAPAPAAPASSAEVTSTGVPAAEAAEEPIVVEDWTETIHAGSPTALGGARAAAPAPAADPEPDDDDSANATMVLADSAALFVRPSPPVPASRAATAPAAAEPADWEKPEQWPTRDPGATQPVPPGARVASAAAAPTPARKTPVETRPPARPAAADAAPPPVPRTRSATVPPAPRRDREVAYEDVPTSPNAPAAPRPAARTHPGPTSPPPNRGRGLLVGVVAGVTLLLGALGIELWFLSHRHKAVASPSPALAEASPLVPPPPTTIPEEVTVVTRPQEQPTLGPPAVQPTAAAPPGVIAPMGGLPTPPVVAPTVPTAPPTVAPATTATRPPVVAATPPPPPPTNPVPGLLAEAERAISARRFDEAISRFNEVLKVDPQNAEATTGRLRAMGERASVGRFFLTAVTVSEGKASSGGIKGFEGGQVVKSQCECALMYEVSPPNPAQGQPYSVSIFMRNDSKKDIKPQSLSVVVTVNGTPSARKVALAATEVAKGQRAMVGKLDDTWKVGTTSWSLEAAVGAGGNTYRAQLTWELRVPAGQ